MPSATTASAARATSSAIAQVRQDNSIGYFLPSNLGGFYGQLMMAAGEGGGSGDRGGKYLGGQFGFRAGPFDVAVAYSEMTPDITIAASAVTGAPLITAQSKIKTANIGGSFDFGFMKLMGYYDEDKVPNAKEKTASISASFPFGQSEVRIGYDLSKLDSNVGPDSKIDNIKATYQYNLSKRTAMYGTIARLNNKDGDQPVVAWRVQRQQPECRWRLEGLRGRHSSLLLIPCSRKRGSEQIERPPSGGLFHGLAGRTIRAIPFDAWRPVCSHCRRDDGAADSFRIRQQAAASRRTRRMAAARSSRCSPGPCSPSSFADSSRPCSSC